MTTTRETTRAIDLEYYHFRQKHGDLTVFGTWWMGLEPEPQPCLCIIRTTDYGADPTGVCPGVVLLENAWVYADPPVGNVFKAADGSIRIAQALGMDSTLGRQRVFSIIKEHLGDLLFMPNRPALPTARVGASILSRERINGDLTGAESFAEVMEDA